MIIHRKEELIRLEQSLQGCGKCPLGPTRTNLVFGRGSETGKIMLIGEGPVNKKTYKVFLLWVKRGSYWTRFSRQRSC